MGRFVYWMNVSLDLAITRSGDTEEDFGDWLRITEELHRDFNARARALSMMVQGRVVYEIMDPFWPDARTDQTLPDYLREYGEIWTVKPKILVSNTRAAAGHNTTVIGGPDAMTRLAQLRRDTPGDIGVGGANVATQLLRAGLLDELMLFIHPAILGGGRPLFDEPTPGLHLDLLESARYDGGAVLHRYAVQPASAPT